MLLTGALMSVVTGQYDISAILASLGVPFVGLVALVLATWTTNVTNAYSGGLALSNLLGFDESKFKVTTGVAGAIGTLLAAFGLLNAFQGFLSLMSALIPPLAGVLIASLPAPVSPPSASSPLPWALCLPASPAVPSPASPVW